MNTASSIEIKNRTQNTIPGHVLTALARRNGKYTDMRDIFHCIQISECHWVGVAGDGANGSYENWSMHHNGLECSDVGYGDTCVALRDILVKEVV